MADKEKQPFTTQDGVTASLLWHAALMTRLVEKGILTTDESNEISATAISMCKANGSPNAAALIENINPSAKGVDPIGAALDRGVSIKREK